MSAPLTGGGSGARRAGAADRGADGRAAPAAPRLRRRERSGAGAPVRAARTLFAADGYADAIAGG